MDVTFGAEHEAFRREARAWLAAHVPPEPLPPVDTAAGFEAHRAWEATMSADRWSAVSWPIEYGGRGRGIMDGLVFEEEYQRAGAPARVSEDGIFVLAPTLLDVGTVAQKERFLPAIAAGEEVWCQAWSEPDASGDLGVLRARADRNPGGNGWRLRAQRAWANGGSFAHWCFGIFRTDPEARRDTGLTCFLIPLDSPGITVRPLRRIDGHGSMAEISFDDVEVPESQVLGAQGSGWSVAHVAGRQRERPQLAQPGALRRRGSPARAVVRPARRAGPGGGCRGPGLHRCAGLPAADVLDGQQGGLRARRGC